MFRVSAASRKHHCMTNFEEDGSDLDATVKSFFAV